MQKRVSIILLNWNSYKDSKDCLESLYHSIYSNCEILLVDNASTDTSAKQLVDEFPNIKFIKNDENLGFAAGNNIGIVDALSRGADYILLLNNDTVVSPDFLNNAVTYAESHPEVGLVGGKIYMYNDKNCIWDAGGEIDWLRGHGKRIGWGEQDKGQFNQPRYTTFVTGCMMLIKREILLTVGLLPEEYFFGVEEWDYSVQVTRAGYKLAYVPNFISWHKVGGAHSDIAPKWSYCKLRSRLLFMRRNAPKYWYLLWLIGMRLSSVYKKNFQYPRLLPHNHNQINKAVNQAFLDHSKKDRVTRQDLENFL